ncbi:MAG TPA: hypothetical protein VLS45_06765, partial [Methylomicrobium sp.]|nr:hypothetical protein [Methylomicrobium sp.]
SVCNLTGITPQRLFLPAYAFEDGKWGFRLLQQHGDFIEGTCMMLRLNAFGDRDGAHLREFRTDKFYPELSVGCVVIKILYEFLRQMPELKFVHPNNKGGIAKKGFATLHFDFDPAFFFNAVKNL